MVQSGGIGTAVAAPGEVLGEQSDRPDGGPHRPCGLGHQRLGRPRLGRLLQPHLADREARGAHPGGAAHERQPAGGAPEAQVPHVVDPFGVGSRPGQAGAVRGEAHEPGHRVTPTGGVNIGDASGPATAEQVDGAADVSDHRPPAFGQRRLDGVEDLGDGLVADPGEHGPPAAVAQAWGGGGTKHGQLRAARQPPGAVVSAAQAGGRAGGQPGARADGAGPQARASDGGAEAFVAVDVGASALASMATLAVAVETQLVGGGRPLEARQPAHRAQRRPGPLDARHPCDAKRLQTHSRPGSQTRPAASADAAVVPGFQLASRHSAHRIAEERMGGVGSQNLGDRIPAGGDEQRHVQTARQWVRRHRRDAGRRRADSGQATQCRAHRASPNRSGPKASTAARTASTSGCR